MLSVERAETGSAEREHREGEMGKEGLRGGGRDKEGQWHRALMLREAV